MNVPAYGNMDGKPVASGKVIDLSTLSPGNHTLTVLALAMDQGGNTGAKSVTFTVAVTIESLLNRVIDLYQQHKIKSPIVFNLLCTELRSALAYQKRGQPKPAVFLLRTFSNQVRGFRGNLIDSGAANLLFDDAEWLIAHL
jgi:hypothetical protein